MSPVLKVVTKIQNRSVITNNFVRNLQADSGSAHTAQKLKVIHYFVVYAIDNYFHGLSIVIIIIIIMSYACSNI